MHELAQQNAQKIYSVSDINALARQLLEDFFPSIYISGEISNFVCPSSGHWYFSLKDSNAQLRCAMFRGANRQVGWEPDNGQQVVVRGKLSLYAPRGDYQLLVEEMEEAGLGALRRQYEKLKQRLKQEGLFEAKHKQAIPEMATRIGIITSPTGAALHDCLSVLARRFPAAEIIVYPTQVQGKPAATQIVNAITTANQRAECDVLLLIRGGGSLEDLWSFNEESVARAIYASQLPIISGIGHEVDFTIADFVADYRAPTPSAAAETASPDAMALGARVAHYQQRLYQVMQHCLLQLQHQLQQITSKLQHPQQRLQQQAQQLDYLEQRLYASMPRLLHNHAKHLQQFLLRLRHSLPRTDALYQQWLATHARLAAAMQTQLHHDQAHFVELTAKLNMLSPLATLQRGYAIVTQQDHVITSSTALQADAPVEVQLAQGKLRCTVNEVDD